MLELQMNPFLGAVAGRVRTSFGTAIAVMTLSALGSAAVAEDDTPTRFDGLEREMSEAEREAAGVESLSPEQLQYLNQWLRQRFDQIQVDVATEVRDQQADAINAEVERRVAQEVAAAREDLRADDDAQKSDEPFSANIIGGFSGWQAGTVFTLDNGQVWRVRHGSTYRHTGSDTRVSFDTNFLGMWQMTVLSTGRSVGVRRID